MMDQIERQKLQELDGSRTRGARGRAAVRRSDLAALTTLAAADIPEADGSVTAEQFNALRAHYLTLMAAISRVAGKVRV